MPLTLKLTNFDEGSILDQTQLTDDVPASATSVPVDNTNDFTLTSFLLLGGIGSKDAELLQSNAITAANAIPLITATQLPHGRYDAVYALAGDKLKVYRAPKNSDGSLPADSVFQANLIATVPIDPNDASTLYTDSSGDSSYWYKYTHFNSFTNFETDLAASEAKRFTVNYCLNEDVRQEAGFSTAL